jgi:hypothetical protein
MAGGWGDVELAERSKIYYIAGSWDPTVQATLAPEGSMYLRVGAGGGALYQKLDNGTTTNWVLNQTSGGGGGAIPVTNNIYVEENGNDTTGDGSISAPVQTINKAITLCSNPALVYAIVPGTGTYNGADVTWLPNVNLFGNGSPVINNNINYTSPAASESYFTFQNIKMGGLLTLDLAPAAIAIHTFTTGSFNIDRVDAAPIGPWAILISDATLGDSSFGGSCILSNILFVSSMEIKAGGRVVASNCPLGIPIDMYDDAYISLQASNTQGAVFTGHPTGLLIPSIVTDTDSFAGASYTDCTIQYANLTGNLINGQVLSGGTVTASQAGSVASVKVDGLGNLASATAEGAYVRGYVHGTTGSELKAEGIASSAIGRPSNGGKILAVGANSLAQGYASGANIEANNQCSTAQGFTDSGGIISSTGISAFARGYAETGGIILSSGLSSNAFAVVLLLLVGRPRLLLVSLKAELLYHKEAQAWLLELLDLKRVTILEAQTALSVSEPITELTEELARLQA